MARANIGCPRGRGPFFHAFFVAHFPRILKFLEKAPLLKKAVPAYFRLLQRLFRFVNFIKKMFGISGFFFTPRFSRFFYPSGKTWSVDCFFFSLPFSPLIIFLFSRIPRLLQFPPLLLKRITMIWKKNLEGIRCRRINLIDFKLSERNNKMFRFRKSSIFKCSQTNSPENICLKCL